MITMPEELPALLPGWEYRGLGWRTGDDVVFATIRHGLDKEWIYNIFPLIPWGLDYVHYAEFVGASESLKQVSRDVLAALVESFKGHSSCYFTPAQQMALEAAKAELERTK